MEDVSKSANAIRQRLAGQVRRLRAIRELTQEALAGRAGIAPRHLQKIEAGQVNVTLETLAKLAVALAVDVSDLLREQPSGQS